MQEKIPFEIYLFREGGTVDTIYYYYYNEFIILKGGGETAPEADS